LHKSFFFLTLLRDKSNDFLALNAKKTFSSQIGTRRFSRGTTLIDKQKNASPLNIRNVNKRQSLLAQKGFQPGTQG
jgi:hypothetical protein